VVGHEAINDKGMILNEKGDSLTSISMQIFTSNWNPDKSQNAAT